MGNDHHGPDTVGPVAGPLHAAALGPGPPATPDPGPSLAVPPDGVSMTGAILRGPADPHGA
ncbi:MULTISPECIES: hypothetical protein [Actinomadura]|uniref:Uncharacterized protein n=1 Tax=Actinomadura yumaensis TaxID=111807 RepID=A0ABW2D1G3_9ACTN|nr:hypothetical protein [Actinomadura sp. J1-007]MWK35528.1 hypothetical protein [Actinomadura sp. J1-007]